MLASRGFGRSKKRRVQSTMRGQTPTSVVLVICLLLASCTSYTVVQIPDDIGSEIHEGDIVKIVTRDGRDLKFKVVSALRRALSEKINKSYASVMLPNWRSRK